VVLFPGGIVPPLASGRSVTEYVSLAYAIGSSAGASLVGSIRKPIVLISQCAKVFGGVSPFRPDVAAHPCLDRIVSPGPPSNRAPVASPPSARLRLV